MPIAAAARKTRYADAMSFYQRFIVPPMIALSMKTREATRYREKVVPGAVGRVLEIGIGSGLNLPFYSDAVSAVVGLEPSPELLAMARKRADKAPFATELVNSPAEDMPFESASFDTVLTTWTLCSIGEPLVALGEMRRVLKPAGRLIFVEHGLARSRRVIAWQNRLNPLWRRFFGGCNLNREIDVLIENAGFAIADLTTEYMKGPKPLTFTYAGYARPR